MEDHDFPPVPKTAIIVLAALLVGVLLWGVLS